MRIIDRAPLPGTTSRALAVQARTLELYRQIGIADAVVGDGVQVKGINLWVKGKKATRVPLGQFGEGLSPFSFALVYPQDAHEKLLIEKLAELGVHVERETALVSAVEERGRLRTILRKKDGTEEKFSPEYLAGCDGASSAVRRQLGIDFPGGTYQGLFYVADVEATGPITNNELHIDLEEADFLLVFPLKPLGKLRLVGIVSENPDLSDGLNFDDVKGRAITRLNLQDVKVNWFSTYRVHHRVADKFRKGRAFLLGDAAHVHSPVGGQGMNTGIGDAINLAWKLAAVLNDGANEKILESYVTERIAFAQRLVATTDRAFTIVTAKGPLARFLRTRVAPIAAPLLFRLPPMRRFMFRTISQLVVQYRKSTLSEGKAGDICAGDRLPWLKTGSSDNHEPLTSLGWQVHVFGKVREGLKEVCRPLGISIHQFAWNSDAATAGFAEDALYLLRPDGYVALADAEGRPAKVHSYFVRHALRTQRA